MWIALAVNLAMFLVGWEAGRRFGIAAGRCGEFFGNATNYALSLFVLFMGLTWRARTALLKGLGMGVYGLYVLSVAMHPQRRHRQLAILLAAAGVLGTGTAWPDLIVAAERAVLA